MSDVLAVYCLISRICQLGGYILATVHFIGLIFASLPKGTFRLYSMCGTPSMAIAPCAWELLRSLMATCGFSFTHEQCPRVHSACVALRYPQCGTVEPFAQRSDIPPAYCISRICQLGGPATVHFIGLTLYPARGYIPLV